MCNCNCNCNTELDLTLEKKQFEESIKKYSRRIIICAGTGCVANGSLEIFDKLVENLKKENISVHTTVSDGEVPDDTLLITKSGCQGFCQMGPLVNIDPDGYLYTGVKVEDVDEIIENTIKNHRPVEKLLYKKPGTAETCNGKNEIPFYKRQHRTILKKCGNIDPENIQEYISLGGYQGVMDVILKKSAKDVCEDMIAAGLRGRGGGGFPTGRKWEFARIEKNEKKYVICNGDEGDPGAFMDRSILEGAPHAVIEGMMIAGYAIGADEGYVYVRMEYPLAVKRIRKAVKDALAKGILGENIFGTDFSFNITVMEGAGAFVCGEETALMSSVEGKRGMPTPKPPFPAQSGLFGKPSVINNVETLATVPLIFLNGIEKFRSYGTENSPGTKTFALTGHVANTGLIEVPFGTTLREIIFEIGGGVTDKNGNVNNDAFKAVQIGGPSGACLTQEHLDLPLDFDSLTGIGAMVGSGGLVVMNDTTCMLRIAKYFMEFTQHESCGKCVLCREGTKQMLALLEDITEGKGTVETLVLLKEVGNAVKKGSLCGLGKTAPNPVLSTMEMFWDECLAHVEQKVCPTRECKALSLPIIDADKCKGCTLCARKCPVNAIQGKVKEAHIIDESICINCGTCIEVCKFNAIS